MPLSEFYLMNDEQIASLHEQLAENFYDDDLYKTVFMDDRTRLKTLRYLFRHYVKALKPYCHFLADSAEVSWWYGIPLWNSRCSIICSCSG